MNTKILVMPIKDLMLSLRVSFRGLNYPLFDGAVSPKARLLLASGNSGTAVQEYQRLAELGSGKARCIIAYAYLLGTPLTPRDLVTARKIALSAEASEPGFSNFIIAHLQLADGKVDSSIKHFSLSRNSGFLPAATAGAQLFSNRYCSAERDLHLAERAFIHAVKVGHIPAISHLARFYLRGARGYAKRLFGAVLLPFGIAALYLAWRFGIFSIRTFYYHPLNRDLFKDIKGI
jgi:TPR repeat protein